MKTCLIVYFSMGGTTDQIAKAIAVGIRSTGAEVIFYNLKEEKLENLPDFDLLGIGAPTYFFRPAYIMLNFIDALPSLKRKPFFTFTLDGSGAGNGAKSLQKKLTNKDGAFVGSFRAHGKNEFVGYLKNGCLFSPKNPSQAELERAEAFGSLITKPDASNNNIQHDHKSNMGIIHFMEKLFTSQWLVRQFYSRLFKLDRKKCLRCSQCINLCPTQNIRKDEHGYPIWGQDCIFCLYCESKCPVGAITSAIDLPIVQPFMKYNIQAAKKNPDIDFQEVFFERGRIITPGQKSREQPKYKASDKYSG